MTPGPIKEVATRQIRPPPVTNSIRSKVGQIKLKLTKKPQAILQSLGSDGVDAVVSLESFILSMEVVDKR